MKYFSLILPLFLLLLFTANCDRFDYDNPLDPLGINKSKFENNPDSCFRDDDGDGIINILDEPEDTAAPKITFKNDLVVYIDNGNNEQLNFYLQDWDATDNGGGAITKHPPTHSVNIYKDSCYIVNYSATDEDGNTGKASRTICVRTPDKPDTTPPILTISDSVLTIPLNSSFVRPKAQAFDLKDGNITSEIEISGTVDTSTVGEYLLKYSVSDFSGNDTFLTVKIIVKQSNTDIDIGLPLIVLDGPDTVIVPENVTFDDFKLTWDDPGATATDNVDGDISADITKSDFTYVNPKYWYIAYNVADKSGNHAQEVKRYFDTGLPEDIQGPIIELNYPDSTIEVVLGGVWTEPGFLATDVIDKDITDKVVVDSSELVANLDVEGFYSVIYTVKNSQGAQTSVTRKVRVVDSGIDTKPPVITLLGDNPDTVLAQSSTKYQDPGATAEDNRDGDVTANITVTDNVNMNSYGKYTVIYRVKDSGGRAATEIRDVYVVRDTLTTDLLVRYNVPSEDPLPTLDASFTTIEIDGEDGPQEIKTMVTKMAFSWSLENKGLYNFQFQFDGPPYNESMSQGLSQTFSSTGPKMTIFGSSVPGLDGKYYVLYEDGEFIWVQEDGDFAIIWTK